MKFNLSIVGQKQSEPMPITINFSLQKNCDGSVGMTIDNPTVGGGPQEFARIQTDGRITLRAHLNYPNPNQFFQYVAKRSPLYNQDYNYVKVVEEYF